MAAPITGFTPLLLSSLTLHLLLLGSLLTLTPGTVSTGGVFSRWTPGLHYRDAGKVNQQQQQHHFEKARESPRGSRNLRPSRWILAWTEGCCGERRAEGILWARGTQEERLKSVGTFWAPLPSPPLHPSRRSRLSTDGVGAGEGVERGRMGKLGVVSSSASPALILLVLNGKKRAVQRTKTCTQLWSELRPHLSKRGADRAFVHASGPRRAPGSGEREAGKACKNASGVRNVSSKTFLLTNKPSPGSFPATPYWCNHPISGYSLPHANASNCISKCQPREVDYSYCFPAFNFSKTPRVCKIQDETVFWNSIEKIWDADESSASVDRRAGNCSHLGRPSVINPNSNREVSDGGSRPGHIQNRKEKGNRSASLPSYVKKWFNYARIMGVGREVKRGREERVYKGKQHDDLTNHAENCSVFPVVMLSLSADNKQQQDKSTIRGRGSQAQRESRAVSGGWFSCLGKKEMGEGYLATLMVPRRGVTQISHLNRFLSISISEKPSRHLLSKKRAFTKTESTNPELAVHKLTLKEPSDFTDMIKPSELHREDAKKVEATSEAESASDSDLFVSATTHPAAKRKQHSQTKARYPSFSWPLNLTTWQEESLLPSPSAHEVISAQWTAPQSSGGMFMWNKLNTNSNNNNIKDASKEINEYSHESKTVKTAWHGETQKRDLWESAVHVRCIESISRDCSATELGESAHMQLKSGNQVPLEPEGVSLSERQQMGTREERERGVEKEGEGLEGSAAVASAVWGGKLQVGEGKREARWMGGRESWAEEKNEEEEWEKEKEKKKGIQGEESKVERGRSQGQDQGSSTSTVTDLDHKRGKRESRADESNQGGEGGETSRGERSLERLIIVADEDTSPGEKERRILMPWSRSRRAANKHPHFSLYNYQVQVAENQPPGTSVMIMSALDQDAGEAGRVSYTIAPLMNSRSSDYFHIHPESGLITTTQILDREHMDQHYFRVTATDHGSPRLSGTTMVAIAVSDRNDHSPIFEQTEYRETIRENVEEGYPILQLRATDSDSPSNANIRYRFIGESAATARTAFEIDPRSGLITTRGSVDREINEHYTLQVEASDQGKDPGPRSATVKVFITVLDENDNVPQFSEKRYVVAVKEDVRPHSEILRVSATDRDKDSNAAVHYNIISGNSRGQFSIDSVTGEIQVVAPLDYESEREYTLRVRAQDNGRPPLSNNTGIVSVQVTDVNDNPPIFVSTPFQASVLESAPVGSSILHIQAIDTDSGDNARLEYRLTGTGSDTPFVINSATGWVTVSSILDRESVEHYFFGVEARDYGMPPLSATASVTITVMDVNDNRPEFLQKEYYARLNEDAAVGTSVVTVTAVDRDVNSAVTYQITGGNTRNRFAISTAGGAGLLSLALPLDYKQERRYVLTVTASDRTLHDTCQVHINITDANTHRPVFQSAHYSVSVNEDRPPGSTVVVISATDDDVGENARITYFLEDNIPQFRIDPATGAITLQAELDYEDQMTYTLAITAKDNGIPQKSDTTYVEVNVNDVNDNAPQFLSPRYQGTVSEDAPPFTSVLQISATDRDAHANGRVQYTFQNGEDGDGDFTIEPTSGIVRTVRRLDRESVPFYELTAYAVDRGVPPQRTPVHIQVTVLDVNDNAPVFPADDFEVLVKENSAVGSVVAQITATDPDEGANAQIMYQIVEGNIPEIFQMDIFSGELTSLIDLDYEARNEYVIVVQATSAPLVSRATVRIRLVDQNDNRPTLKDFQIIFNNFVSNRSNSFPSGVIGRVPAHDPDVSDRLYYTIDRGNELHLLLLNHTSGEIKLSRKLDNNRPLVAPMLITVTDRVDDPTMAVQIEWMMEVPQLYREFYDKPLLLKSEGAAGISTETPLSKATNIMRRFLDQKSVTRFRTYDVQDLLEPLISNKPPSADEHSVAGPSACRQLQQLLKEVLKTLQDEGLVYQRVKSQDEVYYVTVGDKDLLVAVKDIIREDSRKNKYAEKGCHVLHILSAVRQRYSLNVSRAALELVLKALECSSDIISISDNSYTAF